MTDAQLRARLAKAVGKAGGCAKFGARHGLSGPFVSMVITGKRKPSARILKALGLTRTTKYIYSGPAVTT